MLLVLKPADLTLIAISVNLPIAHLSAPDSLLGAPLGDLLGVEFGRQLKALSTSDGLCSTPAWETTLHIKGTTSVLLASVHLNAGLILVELEAFVGKAEQEVMVTSLCLQRSISKLRQAPVGIGPLASIVVDGMRELTGYERVLIYRFDEDWNGQAVAESKVETWDHSLQEIRFPASNIPAQARALYVRSLMRWMPQRDAEQIPIQVDRCWAAAQHSGAAIDLSFAKFRSFSPVHKEFHRSMGVDGSMSISILQDGVLWGLVVCHHRDWHYASPTCRIAAMALTDAFALCVGAAERAEVENARRADTLRLAELLSHMSAAEDVGSALTSGAVTIATLFDSAGAAVLHDDEVLLIGRTPTESAVKALASWLRHRGDDVFHTDSMSELFPEWGPNAAGADGVLSVFLSAERGEMLLWFRGHETQRVNWGGNHVGPEGRSGADPQAPHVFAKWVEEREGVIQPWANWELEIAETLRRALSEVIVRNLRRIGDLNEQLRQSQKMEAVGQLTAGIAHDFNNLLTGVLGSLELTRKRIFQNRVSEVDRYLEAAITSANRAAVLTHRLLAFSRRQTLNASAIDVQSLVLSMYDLIRNSVGAQALVEIVPSPGLWQAFCDANQLENALLNLAINARDAMPTGGRLIIEAANIDLNAADGALNDVTSGKYVAICVTDTGMGMTPEVKARVFEPFFTTKPMGQGTGLGLSMVYGFAKQSEGYVRIDSQPALGTTVKLYLPRWVGEETNDVKSKLHVYADLEAAAGKRVLVVDDEPAILMLVSDTLRGLGYSVVEAIDGRLALEATDQNPPFDMLVTDVGLPGQVNGWQLATAIRERRPDLPVLFITGYAGNTALGVAALPANMYILTKPFVLEALAAMVKLAIG